MPTSPDASPHSDVDPSTVPSPTEVGNDPGPGRTTEPLSPFGHEQVSYWHDPVTGLRAIIALFTTALGPGLGGTRFYPYASDQAALGDVLALSRAMAYKNAMAGLDHGGGKAVILGDPRVDKTPDLLRAYGRFVESLGGRYVTASDVGTSVPDMDVISETTRFATGRSEARGGAGDSSVLTAFGVFQGLRAAAEHAWGSPSLRGRRVGIAGVGKVGGKLADLVAEDGATIAVTDVDSAACRRLVDRHPSAEVVTDAEVLTGLDLDVYAPCAMGGALDDDTIGRLNASVVCGAANNQLPHDGPGGSADRLQARGILYAPDFIVNSGGVIQVADELHGFDLERARARTALIYDTTAEVLRAAADLGTTPADAAIRLAQERIAGASPGGIWLPTTSVGR